MNHKLEIFFFAYVEDLTILTDFLPDLNRKLKLLHQYRTSNELIVNVQKTKVVIVKKSGLHYNIGTCAFIIVLLKNSLQHLFKGSQF